ncbi:MAG: tetratricopeptide repeat protein [Cyanobacteriota bacterium]|nr:tetratricopeptide repeat protein [Cyanobacteriota bacterium]
MDWTLLLKAQQLDFIHRLKTGDLLNCETPGRHRELTIISGGKLEQLQKRSWQEAEKYREYPEFRDVFIKLMTKQLGEEVVKACLGNLVTKVWEGESRKKESTIHFSLYSNQEISIAVKAVSGSSDRVRWWINYEDIEKNAVVVCILIQEEINESTPEYRPILAGFMPSEHFPMERGESSVGINDLLYGGGLQIYLENLSSAEGHGLFIPIPKKQQEEEETSIKSQDVMLDATTRSYAYLSMGIDRYKEGNYQKALDDFNDAIRLNPHIAPAYSYRGSSRRLLGDYQGAIKDYHLALQVIPKNAAIVYNNLGIARSNLGDKRGAIGEYDRALRINPHLLSAYYNRGVARAEMGELRGAILDYSQALRINPNLASVYYNRGVARAEVGEKHGAIDDFTATLNINPNLASAYYNRGLAHGSIGDRSGALTDYQTAADMYQQQGKQKEYGDAIARIRELQG